MEEQTTSTAAEKSQATEETKQQSGASATTEHRQAYGTAKTENLRDSGLWRLLLPAAIIAFMLALFIIPLIILGPLSYHSWTALQAGDATEGNLLWLWITMIAVVVATAATISWGLGKTFLTQAVNYGK